MKAKINMMIVAAAVAAAAGLASPRVAWSQDLNVAANEFDELAEEDVQPSINLPGRTRSTGTALGRRGMGAADSAPSPRQQYQRAVAAIRDAQSEEQRADASSKLREVLEQMFEADMTERQKELDRIAQRLEKLRAQLARRREKKQEIVDLQFQVSINEAEGLGFFSSRTGGRGSLFGNAAGGLMRLQNGDKYLELVVPSPAPHSHPPGEASPYGMESDLPFVDPILEDDAAAEPGRSSETAVPR